VLGVVRLRRLVGVVAATGCEVVDELLGALPRVALMLDGGLQLAVLEELAPPG
jgi:hypothetical protein